MNAPTKPNKSRRRLGDGFDDTLSEISHIDTPEGVVPTRAEIEEEMSPLVKARVLTTATDKSIVPPKETPVRDQLCSAIAGTAPTSLRKQKSTESQYELRERVRETEGQMFAWRKSNYSNRRPSQPVSPTLSPEDAIRNQWILEKNRQGVTVATLMPEHLPQKIASIEEIDFVKAYGLAAKHLAAWILDPRFAKLVSEPREPESKPREKYRDRLEPLREHFEIRTIKGPDGQTIEHAVRVVPPSRSDRRKFGSKVALPVTPKDQPKRRALKDSERRMYLDYADGTLSAEQMVQKHGVWSEHDLRSLELKIIKHAERVGLFVVPVQSKPGPVEPSDSEIPLILKTGGVNLGASIHEIRKRNSFDVGRVRESSGSKSRRDKYGLPEHDDYSEDSAA
jgi:hypothetical protein